MIRTTSIVLGVAAFFVAFATTAFAATPVSVDRVAIAPHTPAPLCRDLEATPDNPLRLRGTGSAEAKGKGEAYFTMKKGTLLFSGQGVVAIQASDNDSIRAHGMGGKHQIGNWLVYWGSGKVQVKGDDYSVIAFGRLSLEGKGTGAAQFHGNWKVHVCKLIRVADVAPRPHLLPQQLDLE